MSDPYGHRVMRRRCIGGTGSCSDGGYAIPGRSRCRAHAYGWDKKPKVRDLAYADPEYKRNRALAIAREPECHWRFPGCTRVSTTADHLVAVSRGGGNGLDNLVGSCRHCNERRGIDLGNATKRRRRR